jgi:hypothetical protein
VAQAQAVLQRPFKAEPAVEAFAGEPSKLGERFSAQLFGADMQPVQLKVYTAAGCIARATLGR